MRLCINAGDPICVTIRKILDFITECGISIRIADILCMCTYVTDLCVDMLTRNSHTDVCEIIETLVDYIIEKNTVVCIHFFTLHRCCMIPFVLYCFYSVSRNKNLKRLRHLCYSFLERKVSICPKK